MAAPMEALVQTGTSEGNRADEATVVRVLWADVRNLNVEVLERAAKQALDQQMEAMHKDGTGWAANADYFHDKVHEATWFKIRGSLLPPPPSYLFPCFIPPCLLLQPQQQTPPQITYFNSGSTVSISRRLDNWLDQSAEEGASSIPIYPPPIYPTYPAFFRPVVCYDYLPEDSTPPNRPRTCSSSWRRARGYGPSKFGKGAAIKLRFGL
ncbi:hypothetical protein PG984_002501 [Apiospora sp. TS-2023a]